MRQCDLDRLKIVFSKLLVLFILVGCDTEDVWTPSLEGLSQTDSEMPSPLDEAKRNGGSLGLSDLLTHKEGDSGTAGLISFDGCSLGSEMMPKELVSDALFTYEGQALARWVQVYAQINGQHKESYAALRINAYLFLDLYNASFIPSHKTTGTDPLLLKLLNANGVLLFDNSSMAQEQYQTVVDTRIDHVGVDASQAERKIPGIAWSEYISLQDTYRLFYRLMSSTELSFSQILPLYNLELAGLGEVEVRPMDQDSFQVTHHYTYKKSLANKVDPEDESGRVGLVKQLDLGAGSDSSWEKTSHACPDISVVTDGDAGA